VDPSRGSGSDGERQSVIEISCPIEHDVTDAGSLWLLLRPMSSPAWLTVDQH
jgi:hypothetical protein